MSSHENRECTSAHYPVDITSHLDAPSDHPSTKRAALHLDAQYEAMMSTVPPRTVHLDSTAPPIYGQRLMLPLEGYTPPTTTVAPSTASRYSPASMSSEGSSGRLIPSAQDVFALLQQQHQNNSYSAKHHGGATPQRVSAASTAASSIAGGITGTGGINDTLLLDSLRGDLLVKNTFFHFDMMSPTDGLFTGNLSMHNLPFTPAGSHRALLPLLTDNRLDTSSMLVSDLDAVSGRSSSVVAAYSTGERVASTAFNAEAAGLDERLINELDSNASPQQVALLERHLHNLASRQTPNTARDTLLQFDYESALRERSGQMRRDGDFSGDRSNGGARLVNRCSTDETWSAADNQFQQYNYDILQQHMTPPHHMWEGNHVISSTAEVCHTANEAQHMYASSAIDTHLSKSSSSIIKPPLLLPHDAIPNPYPRGVSYDNTANERSAHLLMIKKHLTTAPRSPLRRRTLAVSTKVGRQLSAAPLRNFDAELSPSAAMSLEDGKLDSPHHDRNFTPISTTTSFKESRAREIRFVRMKSIHLLPSDEKKFETRRILAKLESVLYRPPLSRPSVKAESPTHDSEQDTTTTNKALDVIDRYSKLSPYPPTPTPVHGLTLEGGFGFEGAGGYTDALRGTRGVFDGGAAPKPDGSLMHFLPTTMAGDVTSTPGTTSLAGGGIPHLFSPVPLALHAPGHSPPPMGLMLPPTLDDPSGAFTSMQSNYIPAPHYLPYPPRHALIDYNSTALNYHHYYAQRPYAAFGTTAPTNASLYPMGSPQGAKVHPQHEVYSSLHNALHMAAARDDASADVPESFKLHAPVQSTSAGTSTSAAVAVKGRHIASGLWSPPLDSIPPTAHMELASYSSALQGANKLAAMPFAVQSRMLQPRALTTANSEGRLQSDEDEGHAVVHGVDHHLESMAVIASNSAAAAFASPVLGIDTPVELASGATAFSLYNTQQPTTNDTTLGLVNITGLQDSPLGLMQYNGRPDEDTMFAADPALSVASPSTSAASPEVCEINYGGYSSSAGAARHPHECKPCAFMWTKGCVNGRQCQFCHEWHLPKKKKPMKDQKNLMIIARPDGKIEFLRCTIDEALRVCY